MDFESGDFTNLIVQIEMTILSIYLSIKAVTLHFSCTYLDTREKASAHTAGHGTSLIITCSLAAWKWTLVTFSSTEVSVATSLLFVLGSPPAVSRMFPPCTTSSSTWVLHFFCTKKKKHWILMEKKIRRTIFLGRKGRITAICLANRTLIFPNVLGCW